MIIHRPIPSFYRKASLYPKSVTNTSEKKIRSYLVTRASVGLRAAAAGIVAAAVIISSSAASSAAIEPPPQDSETLSNIPQTLSGECASGSDCKKPRIQHPKSRKAESCTVKCVNTCIRGGDGSPGEGPLNIRRPLVVFKQGFRSRNYCLVECSDICNLIGDGGYWP